MPQACPGDCYGRCYEREFRNASMPLACPAEFHAQPGGFAGVEDDETRSVRVLTGVDAFPVEDLVVGDRQAFVRSVVRNQK